jgi:FAD/FMN-containing dehydrogenase
MQDASGWEGHPERELAPATAEELSSILAEASAKGIPVTASGARTGLTGGCCPDGGWLVSLHRMTRLDVSPGRAVAGAGVALRDIDAAAKPTGQFYAPDPTEWTASAGGSIATNASGSRSFRYGSTRRHVLALECVMANGEIRRFRRGDTVDFDVPPIRLPATTKNTAGYPLAPGMDWIDLICGSEGTLCFVTCAELQLLPRPADLLTGVLFFPSDAGSLSAVESLRGVPGMRMVEYLDAGSLDLLRPRESGIPAAAQSALLIEIEAAPGQEVDLPDLDGMMDESWVAASDADRERFRAFRHALPETVNDTVRRRGFQKLGSDYAVPITRNAEMLAAYHETLSREVPGDYVVFGHIGDAHLHANILPSSQEEFDRGKAVLLDLARHAVALGGTVSAEHGLGKRKAHLLELQYTPEEIEAMRAVKTHLDPAWLLGRGNLFSYSPS